MASQQYKAWSVVTASTIAFTVCFMIWMMFAVIGIPIKKMLDLNETQFGILIATPVLTGSLIRLPLGMWTDKFGGRIVFFVLMLSTVIPIFMISQATQFWHFLVTGLFVGVAGGSFTVGISYCARWFPKNRQGTAMGIFGAGNTGAAVTKLVAPSIVVAYGWAMVPQMYAVLMLVTAILFWFFTYTCPDHAAGKTVTMREQLAALKDPRVWRYSQYYSIVFGGYVALALWMTKYYITEYGFDLKTAALMAAAFSIPGGVLRALGGYYSDKFGAHTITWWVMLVSLTCLFLLSYPQTELTIKTVTGPVAYHVGLGPVAFTVIMFTLGIAFAIGKASVFKYISDDYPHNIGVISGIVGLAGGMGGFLLPIMFGALVDLTGIRSSAFMLMFGVVFVSLLWMYWTEVRARDKAAAKSRAADILE
ncbi:MAG: nitrate/nitrite transporter [Polaromonas sp.]|jgi:NNP family nitrate/nitrite transporter-like MFS transporter|uniref:MFS transporter n=1 Tax=Polaromonas sp. TaxID=1869339 RepID=UPI0027187C39|nr:nitrate/nitrite transporter [Polaromonas sp.]MDP1703958.1 nitrate/nitrite transporter [Sulfurimicrobium sp.]MDO9114406.1 nitrate/nitrite transporter [Polaromonas sp.]MDP2197547.1 nitrate/nitrite transporter [Sulfurimicrobium sp.]MDP2962459.1 nitrate/nitrite transporter [Sulfurimicrobium sp.]MDZ7655007.1 nitrate/nitrite transporter [Sulfurimicrobium sp.]